MINRSTGPVPSRLADCEARELFSRAFGHRPAHVIRVPLPIPLLGPPTFAVDRLCIQVCLNAFVQVASEPRSDGRIELVRTETDDAATPKRKLAKYSFWAGHYASDATALWADPVKRVLGELNRRKVHVSGLNAAIHWDAALSPAGIPSQRHSGGGTPTSPALTNAAQLTLAMALTLRRLYPFALAGTGLAVPPRRDPKGLLPLLGKAERIAWGAMIGRAFSEDEFDGGHADALSILFAQEWQLAGIDLALGTATPYSFIGQAFVLCPLPAPGVKPERSTELALACRSGLAKLGLKSSRRLERSYLDNARGTLEPLEYACLRLIVDENHRAVAAEAALRADDQHQFGVYVSDACDGIRELLHGNHAADPNGPVGGIKPLLLAARSHPACTAATVTANGQTLVSIVAHHKAADFSAWLASVVQQSTGASIHPFVCQPAAADY